LVFLRPYEEISGKLLEVFQEGDNIICVFYHKDLIEIPKEAFDIHQLKKLTGETAGILNAGEEGYRLRRIVKEVNERGNKNGKCKMDKAEGNDPEITLW
jgi:hypothetical protein